jgi:hypothetical protein
MNTGLTTKDVNVISKKWLLTEGNQAIAKRKGELFKRIKASTVAHLLQVSQRFNS